MNILAFTSRFPLFFSIVILIFLLGHNMRRADKANRKKREEFFAKEAAANNTRKRSLDSVDYIVIPYNELPMDLECEDEIVRDCIRQVNELKGEQIVNLTGITNTDLKLEYGAPNITHLTKCDNLYTILSRTLQEWANRLHELGHDDEALTILEFAIKTRSDISASYYLAARIYSERGDEKKIAWLKRSAETVNSMMSGPILRTLNEKYPDISAY